jgi:pimeloyl-ACP methyl ester carboxylesterase
MPTVNLNGIQLFYELGETDGPPLVLVHGSWESHADWEQVVPALSETFRVLTYDRRGHSQSERPAGGDSVHDDVADLAALIDTLGLAPAWVVGNSFGATICLRLALERPDLLHGLLVHEPPLLALLADDPEAAPMLKDVKAKVDAVLERIKSGDPEGAAQQFIETVAIGPGAWAEIPSEN